VAVELSKNSFDQYAGDVLIISPNIGIPAILDKGARMAGSNESYAFCMNVIGPEGLPASDCHAILASHVHALPLFEIEPETRRLRRGVPVSITIISCDPVTAPVLDSISIADLYEYRVDRPAFLLRHEFFGKDRALFFIKAKIDLLEAVVCQAWLKKHDYLMFDLVQDFPGRDPGIQRACYHALVIRRKDWLNLHLAHITDLHVGRRYDEVLDVLSNELDIKAGKPYISGFVVKKKVQ
jgi:hypothetical protein